MNFQDKKGDDAVEALAGFYLYAIRNKKGEECSDAIRTTFAHDLNGANQPTCEPRSTDYRSLWLEEVKGCASSHSTPTWVE